MADVTVCPNGCSSLEGCLCPPAPDFGVWKPIKTAPMNTLVLLYWPAVGIDEDGELTGVVLDQPGYVGVSDNTLGGWEPPEALNAVGSHFDDDFEYGEPTHWMSLPTPPGP